MQRIDEIFLALPAMRPRPSFLQTYRFGMTRAAAKTAMHPSHQRRGEEESVPHLTQFDLVGDLMRQADATDGENHLGRQLPHGP